MKEIIIGTNDAGQRLDRFLRKYLCNAPLSRIYKIIRKDVKVGGKRCPKDYMLSENDVITLYLPDADIQTLTKQDEQSSKKHAKRQFKIIYEDDEMLIVYKPFGLLTHGDSTEKKSHLANQVRDYLIEQGSYIPQNEKTFAPAPANRLDRNTTGLVVFGKTAQCLKELNRKIRENEIKKYYLTIVHGKIENEMTLEGKLSKDEKLNKVSIGDDNDLEIKTIVKPLETLDRNTTLVEVLLVTGRSHQIRAHLASIGNPIIGDNKYMNTNYRAADAKLQKDFKLTTQLLHAYKLEIDGAEYIAYPPPTFMTILKSLGGEYGR